MDKRKTPNTERLIQALLSVKDEHECYQLLEDLLTIKEMQDLGQRIEVALLLREKITYNEIAQRTGVSTATISRVNRSLSYGAGGYEMVLGRIEKKDD